MTNDATYKELLPEDRQALIFWTATASDKALAPFDRKTAREVHEKLRMHGWLTSDEILWLADLLEGIVRSHADEDTAAAANEIWKRIACR